MGAFSAVVVLATVGHAAGQPPAEQKYTSKDGKFTVTMLGKVTTSDWPCKVTWQGAEHQSTEYTTKSWTPGDFQARIVDVRYVEFPGKPVEADRAQFLPPKRKDEKKTTVGKDKLEAVEYHTVFDNEIGRITYSRHVGFFAGNRYYAIAVRGTKEFIYSAEANNIIQSFEFLK